MELGETTVLKLMSFKEAKAKVDDPFCCFELRSFSTHLALSPKYIGSVGRGVRKQLDSKLTLYSEELDGVPIAYSSARVLQSNGWLMDDEPFIHCDISADYVVFRPVIGTQLHGIVNKIGTGFAGCLVHSTFNAALLMTKEDYDEPESVYARLTIGCSVWFEVVDVHIHRRLLSMSGKPLSIDGNNCVTDSKVMTMLPSTECIDTPSGTTRKKHKGGKEVKQELIDSDFTDLENIAVKIEPLSPPPASSKKKKHKRNRETL